MSATVHVVAWWPRFRGPTSTPADPAVEKSTAN
jgi:hypothetical protein